MKTVVPDYYRHFACRKGDCLHSCCVGWEIDIDPEKLAYYDSLPGDMGKLLKENIQRDGDSACFRLTADERCPFLNPEGLCEMILRLGEDSLCQICADHPRFRNFFSDREEIGLGLCCEAACALILKRREPVRFIVLQDDGEAAENDEFEQELLELRAGLIAIMQDRSLKLDRRIDRMLESVCLPRPVFNREWRDSFLGLERLDPCWGELLEESENMETPLPCPAELEICLEQLIVYLLQRHMPGALEDGDIAGRILFAVLFAEMLKCLGDHIMRKQGHFGADDLVELARMASSEIEYSDENTAAILDQLHDRYPEI